MADTNNHRIQKFNAAGTFITRWGIYGPADGQFNYPGSVALDSQGNVYVTEWGNHRIQKFSSTGSFITKWGVQGSAEGEFSSPVGVVVDSQDNNYVADSGNHRIQKFGPNGTFIATWGTYGAGDGQFNGPAAVAVDSQGNIYVADSGNHRVQKFSSTGNFITKWGTYGSGDGQFYSPQGTAVDRWDNVYVVELWNHRVQKFSSTGDFITKWGAFGSGEGQFNRPQGAAVDSQGSVYVADHDNSRVQKFSMPLYSTTTYTYDVLGNLTQVVDNAGNTTTMNYDWLSRKTGMTDPDMGTWSYVYDNNGNLTGQTDAKTQAITFVYDALSRLITKTYPGGSGMTDVAYTYDDVTGGNRGKGRRTGMTDAVGSTTYKYDTRGRLIEEKRTIGGTDYTTGFAYDGADRVTAVTYPTGEIVTQAYNGRGLPNTLSGSLAGNLVAGALYNALGQATEVDLGNGLRTTFGYYGLNGTYDTTGGYYARLWEIKTLPQGGGAALQDVRHTWDAAGNLAQRQDILAGEIETFGYDGLDRLTSVSGPYSESYTYSEIGNLMSKNGVAYSYPLPGQPRPHAVTQVGATGYAYDANGNMTTRGALRPSPGTWRTGRFRWLAWCSSQADGGWRGNSPSDVGGWSQKPRAWIPAEAGMTV